jgi:GTP-binding protein
MSSEIPRSVAVVGRPNVGKSRLFNRILNRRVSIVHDAPGVTRDLITEQCEEQDFLLMDTGGIGLVTKLTPKVISDAIEEQVAFAIQAAGIVLFVVDVTEGCVPLDETVATMLRKHSKKVILIANKCDNESRAGAANDFHKLGFGPPIQVSAEHGSGVGFLLMKIAGILGPRPEATGLQVGAPAPDRIKICVAGRPNVGKSSIGNRMLKTDRLVVSEIPGTTRDPVKCNLDYKTEAGDTWHFELVDTAGRRASTKHDVLDYFSELRSDDALGRADVVILVISAEEGVTRMDKQLAGKVAESGAGLIIVVNKWDLVHQQFRAGEKVEGYDDESEFRRKYKASLRHELFFLPDSPVVFTSAKTDFRTENILAEAREIHRRMYQKISTGNLNKALEKLFEKNPPRLVSGKRFKCYYATQTHTRPLTIRLYCNSYDRLDDQYERYLDSGLHESFDLAGVPIKLRHIGKPKDDDPNRAFFKDQQTAVVGGKRQGKASAGRVGKYNATGETRAKAENRTTTKAGREKAQRTGTGPLQGKKNSGKTGPARTSKAKSGGFKDRGQSDQQRTRPNGVKPVRRKTP